MKSDHGKKARVTVDPDWWERTFGGNNVSNKVCDRSLEDSGADIKLNKQPDIDTQQL